MTLNARESLLSDIGKSLAVELGAVVDVSPAIAGKHVTLVLRSQPLSEVLPQLSPGAFVDVETDSSGVERTRKIMLQPAGEEPPPPPRAVEVLILEGDTDDETVTSETLAAARNEAAAAILKRSAESDDPPLVVAIDGDRVSLRARQVPVLTLLTELAAQFGTSFAASGLDGDAPLNIDIRGTAFEALPSTLAIPDMTVLARRNLVTGSIKPLEIRIGPRGAPKTVESTWRKNNERN